MGKDAAAKTFIRAVNALMNSSPVAAQRTQRYEVPAYDEARHAELSQKLQDVGVSNPTPEQLLQLHVFHRGNVRKPRKRKPRQPAKEGGGL